MKTIQIAVDKDFAQAVDRVSKQLRTSRSACTRNTHREAPANYPHEELERKHRLGYEQHPVASDEFSVWEADHAWGDD